MRGPGFADPLNNPFWAFIQETVLTLVLIFSCAGLVCVLIRTRASALLASVYFNEETLAGQLVP